MSEKKTQEIQEEMIKKEVIQTRKDSRKIFLASSLIILWSISYGMIVLSQSMFEATTYSLSVISNLIADAFVVIFFGLSLVIFYAISDFFIKISIDPLAAVKLEYHTKKFREDKEFFTYLNHISSLRKYKYISYDDSPIPKSENFAVIYIGIYYLINFIGITFMTEILFFTMLTTSNDFVLLPEQETILPILASSLVIGGKVASIFYKNTHDYGQMLTETLFIFLLFGIISNIHQIEYRSFIEIFPGEHAMQRFFSIIIYLAMIPCLIEIGKWILYLQTKDD